MVRWGRTLGLALPLIILRTRWITHSEMRTGVTEITITTQFMDVALVLFLLNTAVRRFFPDTYCPPELFSSMPCSLGTSVVGIGNLGFFATFLTTAWCYGPERNWEWFFPDLPPMLLGARDPERLKVFWEGRSTFFSVEALTAWAPVLLFWLDLFVAWCFKAAFLRYGGIKLYRAALPFFLGLILGDFVTGALWSLIGLVLGVEVYSTFPN